MANKQVYKKYTEDRSLQVERYNSLNEFYGDMLFYIKNKPPILLQALSDMISDDKERYGANDIYEVIDFINKGYDKSVEKLNETLKMTDQVFHTGAIKQYQKRTSLVGNRVNMNAYFKGQPNTMFRMTKQEKEKPIINIYYDCCVSHTIPQSSFEEKALDIVSHIVKLEKQGYKVRLSVLFGATQKNKYDYACVIPVKTEQEPFFMQKLAFPTTAMSFVRVLLISIYYEIAIPFNKQVDGRGRPIKYDDATVDFLTQLAQKNEKILYVSYYSDLEKTFNF